MVRTVTLSRHRTIYVPSEPYRAVSTETFQCWPPESRNKKKKKITTGFFFSLQFVYFTFKKIINHEKNNEYFP